MINIDSTHTNSIILVIALTILAYAFLVYLYFVLKKRFPKQFNDRAKEVYAVFSAMLPLLTSIAILSEITDNQAEKDYISLVENNYFYSKTFTQKERKDIHFYINKHVDDICQGGEYKVTNYYNEVIDTNQPITRNRVEYLFCKDTSGHNITNQKNNEIKQQESTIKATFVRYPSSYAIEKHCDTDKAFIVDRNNELLNHKQYSYNVFLRCIH